MVNRLERGESPEAIEGSMGDAFGGEASDGMDDVLGAPPPEPAPVEPPAPKRARRRPAATPKPPAERTHKRKRIP